MVLLFKPSRWAGITVRAAQLKTAILSFTGPIKATRSVVTPGRF